MIIFVWVIRAILFLLVIPFLIPLALLAPLVFLSPLSLALFILALVLLALGVVLGIALGVIGNLIDLFIVLGLIGLIWKWPRGIRAGFYDKLKLSYRSLRNTIRQQVRRFTAADLALCLVVLLIATILSLSCGFFHFLLTVLTVLAVIGIVWKWPPSPNLTFFTKLRVAIRALAEELRRIFR